MTRFRSPRLLPYALLLGGAAILSIVIGRAEAILIASPFIVVLAAAALGRGRPDLDCRVSIDRDRVLEGEELGFLVEVASRSGRFEVGFVMDLPPGLELIDPPRAVMLAAGSSATMQGRLRCRRWGAHTIGGGVIQARDLASTFLHQKVVEPRIALRVYPRPELLRSYLRPRRLRPHFGSLVSRISGVGLEFADIREFTQGDERRHVNWKATARHRQLHVNLFHPERSADVILLLDAFTDVAGNKGSSLDLAVRGATAVAMECLRRRDRVGLLSIGGTTRWLLPGLGTRQLYRLVDSLMQSQLVLNYAWPDIQSIPRNVLPPGALVIALTPLADRRTPAILLDLHARGHDLAVVEIPADALLPVPSMEREQLAHRLWSLHRDAIRGQYLSAGVAVAVWDPDEPLRIPFMKLQRFRRSSRRTPA